MCIKTTDLLNLNLKLVIINVPYSNTLITDPCGTPYSFNPLYLFEIRTSTKTSTHIIKVLSQEATQRPGVVFLVCRGHLSDFSGASPTPLPLPPAPADSGPGRALRSHGRRERGGAPGEGWLGGSPRPLLLLRLPWCLYY